MCPNDAKNAMKYNLLVLGGSLNLMQISHDTLFSSLAYCPHY